MLIKATHWFPHCLSGPFCQPWILTLFINPDQRKDPSRQNIKHKIQDFDSSVPSTQSPFQYRILPLLDCIRSLVVQCLRLHAPNAEDADSIPGQIAKISHAAQPNQKLKISKQFERSHLTCLIKISILRCVAQESQFCAFTLILSCKSEAVS